VSVILIISSATITAKKLTPSMKKHQPSFQVAMIAAATEGPISRAPLNIDEFSAIALPRSFLSSITDTPRARRQHETVWHQFKEGWSYAFGFTPVRTIILLLGIVCLLGVPYGVLMPIVAGDILHGGPRTFGLLMTASGFGALVGALWLAARPSVVGLSRVIPVAAAMFGTGLIGFSASRYVAV